MIELVLLVNALFVAIEFEVLFDFIQLFAEPLVIINRLFRDELLSQMLSSGTAITAPACLRPTRPPGFACCISGFTLLFLFNNLSSLAWRMRLTCTFCQRRVRPSLISSLATDILTGLIWVLLALKFHVVVLSAEVGV